MSHAAIALFLGIALTVGGCIYSRAETASRAQSEMIGLKKSDILSCMGAAASKEADGQIEVWSYPSGGDVDLYSTSSTYGTSTYNPEGYTSTSTKAKQRYSVVSIVMENEVVTRVNYQARTRAGY